MSSPILLFKSAKNEVGIQPITSAQGHCAASEYFKIQTFSKDAESKIKKGKKTCPLPKKT
jgi:hypothetical protein